MNNTKKISDIMTSEAADAGQRILRHCVEKAIGQYMKYLKKQFPLEGLVSEKEYSMDHIYNSNNIVYIYSTSLMDDDDDDEYDSDNGAAPIFSHYYTLPDLIAVLKVLEDRFSPLLLVAEAIENNKINLRNGTMRNWRNKYRLEMNKLVWEHNMQDGWLINIYNLHGGYIGTLQIDSGKLIFDI